MAGDFDINDADFAADATQSIDTVVARVREVAASLHRFAQRQRTIDDANAMDALATAYESAVRERDEARGKCEAYRATLTDYERDIGNAQEAADRARTALRRVREAVAVMDGGTIHANGQQFPAPNAIYRAAVLDIIDREATDA